MLSVAVGAAYGWLLLEIQDSLSTAGVGLAVCCSVHGYALLFLPQHINELTMKLSVEDVLTRAEVLYRQLTACPVSPASLPTASP